MANLQCPLFAVRFTAAMGRVMNAQISSAIGFDTDAAIEISGLTKVYSGGKTALDDVSLRVPRGQIFGLLGPNGAGKSTLINILAGIVKKTSGTARIWGFDLDANPRNAKNSIGIVNQEILFDPFFTPLETLENQAGFYGVPKASRRSMELLHAVHLADKADAYSRTLSGGMKRRLMVAKAMVHSPPILVLDEPTAGVDIMLRQQLWDYVRQLNQHGVTIVLTTHYLEEAEELCDRVAIINHGKVITDKPTRELVGMAQEKLVQVTVDQDVTEIPSHPCFEKVELVGDRRLDIIFRKDRTNAGQVLAAVQNCGFQIVDVVTREPDLEDIFLTLTAAAA
jgi:ABC-2 type transport system ATP-binding protein